MSENITHTAICDDGYRLATVLPGVPLVFRDVWGRHRDASRLGGITRHADRWSARIVQHAREELPKPTAGRDPWVEHKLAFVLGSFTHRSIDRHMKPVFDRFKKEPGYGGVNLATIYCDVFILREVFAESDPYTRQLLSKDVSVPQLEELMRTVLMRTLIRMHTFNPDDAHIHEWMGAMFQGLQDFKIAVPRYVEIAASWEPSQVKRYLEDTNFYDREEPLIRAARRVQHGETIAPGEADAALQATTDRSSRYARALRRALEYIRTAGELFEGRISQEEAEKRFDVGVPELSLG